MKKGKLYGIVAFLLVLGVYGYEFYLEEKHTALHIEEGEKKTQAISVSFLPTSTTGQIVHHQGYSLSYSEPHEQAEWVAYQLEASHLSKSTFPRPYFEVDQAIKTGAASWRNYKNSGYNRGHLCPAGDKTYSQSAHDETFLTSNISPQNHEFNAGIWNDLEKKVRYWARKYDGVFVVTGGVLEDDLPTIGNERVAVPEYFYKIVYDAENEKMIAFVMPNKASKKSLSQFIVAVDSVESITGIDFYPTLPDVLESQLEAMIDFKSWQLH